MKTIPLTKGMVALVDDEDFSLVSKYRWYATISENGRYYAKRRTNAKHQVYLHREIMKASLGVEIDHIDGNGLNNQKSNLRYCIRRQNAMNTTKRKPSATSRHKGVCWDKRCKKWTSKINPNGRTINLGLFENEIDAAIAYNKAAMKHFGEYARLNNV